MKGADARFYAMMLDDTDDRTGCRNACRGEVQRDSLTGLLNREASENRISEFLEEASKLG